MNPAFQLAGAAARSIAANSISPFFGFPMKFLYAALLWMLLLSPAVADPALDLRVHVPFVRASLSATIPVAIVWTNRSTSQRVVLRGEPGPTQAGGLSLFVVDDNGVSRALVRLAGRLSLDEVVNGSRRIELAPGHGHGISKRFRVNEIFPAPGRYRIEARYQSPLPVAGNSTISPGAIEGSSAVAMSVEIEVTP